MNEIGQILLVFQQVEADGPVLLATHPDLGAHGAVGGALMKMGTKVGGRRGCGSCPGAEKRSGGVSWHHAQIMMHELSHLWCAEDDGYWGYQGDGVMNYYEAADSTEYWDKTNARAICYYFQTCYVP